MPWSKRTRCGQKVGDRYIRADILDYTMKKGMDYSSDSDEDTAIVQYVTETLQTRSAKLFLFSDDLELVQFATRLLGCEKIAAMGVEVVSHALWKGDESIIRYLANSGCFDFKEHAQKAFTGDLEVRSASGAIWWDRYPLSTYQLLTDPSLGLQLDYPLAMENAIKRGELEIVQFLSTFEEVDLPNLGQNYLLDATYDGVMQTDIFFFLLGLEDVQPEQETMDNILGYVAYPYDDGFFEALRANLKTRSYVVAYEREHEYVVSEDDD